jgi:hypothetical protein
MTTTTSMDLRYPIGLLFVLLGAILAIFGWRTGSDVAMYARSAGVNVNLIWGVVMVAVGSLFLWRAARGASPAA